MLTTIRQALHLMGREQRARWVLLIFLAILTSVLEIVAAALVFVLLGLVANPQGTIDLPIVGDIRRLAAGVDERTLLLSLIGIMIVFFLLRAIITMGAEYVMARVTGNAAARLSIRLAKGYLSMPYSFHLQHSSAELIRNGHNAPLEVVGSVFTPLIRMFAEAVLTIGVLVLLVVVSPVGTGLAVVVVGGATGVLMLLVQPRLKRMGAAAWRFQRETLASLQESYQGARDIKLLGREDYFAKAYGRSRLKLARLLYVQSTLWQAPRLVIETSLIGFILIFFGYAIATRSSTGGTISILGLFAYAGLRLQPSLQRIIGSLNSLKAATASTGDLYHDLQMVERMQAELSAATPLPFAGDIRLDDVSFRYESSDRMALESVSLSIRSGEQIGICGPTGGGKTTLVDLISGLLTPTTGRVTVDGRDIAGNLRGWQRNLGVVSQMIFLTNDTLRHNVALGVEDKDVDEAALADALRLAQMEEFIAGLPDGLDTVVGERGVRLSGGERQRIAIARALYYRPQVLIFDEGTSALDNATEQELMRALKALRGDHTILLVAHRLSTVRDADRVIFVEGGTLSGIDTFDELLKSNEQFRAMAGAA